VPAILLLLPRSDVEGKIEARIALGHALLNQPINNYEDLRHLESDEKVWHSFNAELLRNLFTSEQPAEEYEETGNSMGGGMPNLSLDITWFRRDIERCLVVLRSILAKIELWPESPAVQGSVGATVGESPDVVQGNAVFIVHGRAGREAEVARAVEQLGLEAVILQERLHGGSATLIEKLEREARSCGYAIVVYTGDDEGRMFGSEDALAKRARENVVLELGYFVGHLGRQNVTILHDPAVTVPSDFLGVGYYTLDPAGAWKERVAGELRLAGLLPK